MGGRAQSIECSVWMGTRRGPTVHTCMGVRIRVLVYACVRACVCVRVSGGVRARICPVWPEAARVRVPCAHVHVYSGVDARVCTRACVRVWARLWACVCVCVWTSVCCTCVCARANSEPGRLHGSRARVYTLHTTTETDQWSEREGDQHPKIYS